MFSELVFHYLFEDRFDLLRKSNDKLRGPKGTIWAALKRDRSTNSLHLQNSDRFGQHHY